VAVRQYFGLIYLNSPKANARPTWWPAAKSSVSLCLRGCLCGSDPYASTFFGSKTLGFDGISWDLMVLTPYKTAQRPALVGADVSL